MDRFLIYRSYLGAAEGVVMRQRVKRYGVGTCAFVVLLAGVGKLSLASDFATRRLVTRLQAAAGTPLHIATVDLGYSSSTLRGLDVLENASHAAPPPWATARDVEADVSLWQLLCSDLARGSVTFRDAA